MITDDKTHEENVAYLAAAKKREEAEKKRQQVIQGIGVLIAIPVAVWIWFALSPSKQVSPQPDKAAASYDPASDLEVLNCIKKKGFGNWHEDTGVTLEKFCEASVGLYYRQKLLER